MKITIFRLMGCQDLLEDVPGRLPRRDQGPHISSPADLRSFVRATGKGLTGRGSSKSYSIKEETSSKIFNMYFVTKPDNFIFFQLLRAARNLVLCETKLFQCNTNALKLL